MNYAATTQKLLPTGLALASLALVATPTARACIGDQFVSIHFNSGNPDFGTPPRRSTLNWRGERFNRPVHDGWGNEYEQSYSLELTQDKDNVMEDARRRQTTEMRRRADAALAVGDWTKARNTYTELAKAVGWTGGLRDRVEILDYIIGQGKKLSPTETAGRRKYLSLLDKAEGGFYKGKTSAAPLFDALSQDISLSRDLRGHAAYQGASAFVTGKFFGKAKNTDAAEALLRFVAVSHAFPEVKPEATLIMIARTALLVDDPAQQRPDVAANAIHGLLMRFPKSRFRRAAIGLRARIDYLQGRYDTAANTYFTLGDLDSIRWVRNKMPPSTTRDRLDARLLDLYLRRQETTRRYYSYANNIRDIDYMLRVLSPAGADLFVQRLLQTPDLASSYFYYRLYHCENKPKDLLNLARLADRIAGKSESQAARLPRLLQTRLAEVYYQRGDYDRALPWAERAVAQTADQSNGDRALFVRGAIYFKQHRNRAARADFDALLSGYPTSPLRTAAHEEIALEAEASGDLGDALQHYFYLEYQPDIAYFLDARMTSAEVAQFLEDHPKHPQKQLIRYSLGMRYLRENRLAEAKRTFLQLPNTAFYTLNKGRQAPNYWSDEKPGPNPLNVIEDLQGLKKSIAQAEGTNARAEARYRYASYFYTHGTLLLYNGALWKGSREFNFDFFWNKSHATGGDTSATHRHMYEHEVYARTSQLCKEIVSDYPHSSVAPRALYRAACCEAKLGNFNGWWRENTAHNANHYKVASRLMKQLARDYPKDSLASHAKKYAFVFYTDSKPM